MNLENAFVNTRKVYTRRGDVTFLNSFAEAFANLMDFFKREGDGRGRVDILTQFRSMMILDLPFSDEFLRV